MKKIIVLLVVCLVGCFNTKQTKEPVFTIEAQQNKKNLVTVGLFLPLSGPHEKIGEAFKNTAILAVMDLKNDNMVLRFYDTEGTAEGAKSAFQRAIKEDVKVTIGPLFSHEVEAIKTQAKSKKIPMLALSSDPAVLERGVYTVSILMPQQVDRIITYACEKKKRKFAVLAQDNEVGKMMVNVAEASAERCGARVTKVGYYNVRKGTYDKAVKDIIGQDRIKWIDEERKKGKLKKPKTEEVTEDPFHVLGGEEPMEAVEEENKIPDLPFDAVLISEEGNRLRQIGSLLSFYEIDAQLLGTSLWANDANIQKEIGLLGGWYAAPSQRAFATFRTQYRGLFKENPPRITSQVYDAVKIVSTLVERNAVNEAGITDPHGFLGIDGPVRFLPNGLSDRGLEVKRLLKRSLPTLSEVEPFNNIDPYYLNRKSGIVTPPEKEKPSPEELLMMQQQATEAAVEGEFFQEPITETQPVYIIDAPME